MDRLKSEGGRFTELLGLFGVCSYKHVPAGEITELGRTCCQALVNIASGLQLKRGKFLKDTAMKLPVPPTPSPSVKVVPKQTYNYLLP